MSNTARARGNGRIRLAAQIVAAGLIVLVGLLIVGTLLLNHFAPQYRAELANRIGQRIDSNVQIGGLEVGWGWHGPILYLNEVKVIRRGLNAPALTADRIGLEFSVADLLNSRRRLPDGVIVDGLKAGLVLTNQGPRLTHWLRPGDQQSPFDPGKLEAVRHQLAELRISNSRLTIQSPRLPHGRLRWSDIDIRLSDQRNRKLRVALSADGPAWWPRLTGSATLRGPLQHPDRAVFTLHADGLRPLVAARHDQIPLADKLGGGTLGFDIKGQWHDDRLADTTITVDGQAVRQRIPDKNRKQPLVPAFQAVFDATNDPDTHELSLRLDRLNAGPETAADMDIRARINTRTHALDIDAKRLPVALASRIARLAVPRLAKTDIAGSMDDLALRWAPRKPLKASLDFHGLKVNDPRMAFGPIAGHYEQQGDHHRLRFTGAGGTLSAKRYIHGALDVTNLTGSVSWQTAADGARLMDFDELRLDSRRAHLITSGNVRLPADGKMPVVNLTADMAAPHVARLLDHIPRAEDLPNPRLRDWLTQAVTAGTLDHGHVEVKGPMNRFPFAQAKKGEGFHMTLKGHDVDVRYKPGWPQLTQARGTLTLSGDTLDLDLPAARMLGVDLSDVKGHVDDVREPVMHLAGHARHAPAPKLLAFLAQSPLHDKFGKLIKAIDVTGDDDLAINLRIPLKPGLGRVKVDGAIDARGNTLRQSALPGPIHAIKGTLHFTRRGLRASGLTGLLLGVPIKADLSPASGGAQKIVARASPILPANRAALAHYLPNAWLVYGRGKTPLTVAFTVARSGRVSPIHVTGDMRGMAVNLPAPLTKKARTAAPLDVTVDLENQHIRASYDHDIDLSVQMTAGGTPRRIQATIGESDVQPPDADGLWIGGHAKAVDGLGWFHVVRHVLYGTPVAGVSSSAGKSLSAPETKPSTTALTFLGGDLTINRLNFGDRFVPNTHIRAQPMNGTEGWRVNFEGNDSQGQITWTAPSGQPMRIAGNLKRIALHTETIKPARSSQSTPDSTVLWPEVSPSDLPTMKLYVKNFVVDNTSFGQAHLDARSMKNGWQLNRFQLAGGALTGKLGAHWQKRDGMTRAGAKANFDGHGLARLLRTFGYVSPIRAKLVHIKTDLSIQRNRDGLDLRFLNGHLHLAVNDGTLLTVEPGPGRLLGLFNLYVLPRRLGLNFRDVVDKGMAFDKASADFRIHDGQAYSNNLHIATPSATIGITGRIGLATRDYDEHVTVSPKVGSGLAVAGAVIGGPIVGAAVFAVQQLLKKPIKELSSVSYNLKGSWDNPQIVNPSANARSDDKAKSSDARPAG